MEFKDLIKLDKDCLDSNAIEQVSIHNEWSEKWAKSVLKRDKAKENFAVILATASQEIRTCPELFGWDFGKAPTETFINSKIPLHPLVQEAQEKLNEAQYETNLYSSAKETIEQRGRMLTVLVDLYKSGYFSTKSHKELKDKAIEKISEEQQAGLNKNPRLKRK